ncbi:MAG: glycoside hydrolase family 9 protein [Prolixibacteraceae bacterium]|jgi:endoglucanase|nr:glycoside hydrolase family 9 protein [Prolixibacteraceae bacterium]
MKFLYLTIACLLLSQLNFGQHTLKLNEKGYFEMPGLNVTVFSDIYPEGHQTGVSIIQHGQRVAANGDVRLEVSPGQWSPIPKALTKSIDAETNTVSQTLIFPDSSRNNKGFNPISYPDLVLRYTVNVTPLEKSSFKVSIDLEEELPEEWVGKVGFNLELFPGHLFGKSFIIDNESGIFPVQANGPIEVDQGHFITQKMASGKHLTIAPEEKLQRIQFQTKGAIELWDGRGNHNNAWFIVREQLKANTTKKALEWIITPAVDQTWKYEPVIHISQVGYHPNQLKKVVIETDLNIEDIAPIRLMKVTANGLVKIKELKAEKWGNFLRYNYFIADFSEFTENGMYILQLDNISSNPFKISPSIYQKDVWQPVIDYFLPVQMCHVRVKDHYKVWHDACHLDDALMAPNNLNHFDGYHQRDESLCEYEAYDQVPGLNEGGWHDAGDFDLRVESQIGTIQLLSLMLLEFDIDYDATLIDVENKLVEIHKADGKNDVVQQIEHGLKSVLGAYRSLGRLYRGIICPTLEQYVMLGDAAASTDNLNWDDTMLESKRDDRLVFTEKNQRREAQVGTGLAITAQALQTINPDLSKECLETALALWNSSGKSKDGSININFATALLGATEDQKYAEAIYSMEENILERIGRNAMYLGRVLPLLKDKEFRDKLEDAIKAEGIKIKEDAKNSPFGVPYQPHIWGHGWTNQRFGVEQYFIHKAWPNVTKPDYFMNALNFNLGVHPGENTASFASGVGSNSVLVGYGLNRADWSYIPGGVVSGTALIRPDLPELKEWPYFWQQTEYVMGGGSTNFMFLVLAVDHYLNQ